MLRKLKGTTISLLLLMTQQVLSADAALQHLNSKGIPPTLSPKDCALSCKANTCQTDLQNKSYRCFYGCANHTGIAQIMSCVNTQFNSYIGDLITQINTLKTQNNNQTQQIGNLQNQLNQNINQLENFRQQHQQEVQKNNLLNDQYNALHIRYMNAQQLLYALLQKNSELQKQLADAENTIRSRGVDIERLRAEIKRNQDEINSLNKELDDGFNALQELIKQFDIFTKGMGSITGMFKKHKDGIVLANNALKDQIKQVENFMREHEAEIMPFILQNEKEFNEMIKEMESDLFFIQGFIDSLKADMNKAQSGLKDIHSELKRATS